MRLHRASKDESLQVIKDASARRKERRQAWCWWQVPRATSGEDAQWAPGIDAMVGVFDRDKIIEAVVGSQQA